MDRSGCFEKNQRNHHRRLKIKLAYVRQPLVGFFRCIYHWRMEGNQRLCIGLEISAWAPLRSRFRPRFFLFWKHPEFQSPQRPILRVNWAFNPWTKKTYEVQFDCFLIVWKLFSCPNFPPCLGGDEVQYHRSGEVGNLPWELQLTWLNRSWVRSSKSLTLFFLGWFMPLKNAELFMDES